MRVRTGHIARLAVDRKTIDDDPSDDLALIAVAGEEHRLQAKLGTNSEKTLALGDPKNASSESDKLHADAKLFEKAYGYIVQYY